MAYRPSKRAKHGSEWVHTNITPMMNLMVILIPLLLTSAEFVKLGVIEMPQEDMKRLDLSISVTDRGFFISSSYDVLQGDIEGEPSIPLVNDIYDFQALTMKLYEIKQKAENRFPDANQIIIIAEQDIDYQTLVSTMDATRLIKINGINEILFPDVSLSAGIF